MVKTQVIPCTKEEILKLIESSADNNFYYTLFVLAKTTGRRLGEFWGVQKKKEIGRKIVGNKIEYDINGNKVPFPKTRAIYKKIPGEWEGGLKWKDIDLDKEVIRFWVLKRKKLVQDETILGAEAKQTLTFFKAVNKPKEDDYVFRTKSYRSIQEAVERYAKKAGVKHNVSFHNFRHYFITEFKRLGWSNDKIAKLTGHKDAKNISIYDHIIANDIKEETIEALKNF